MKVAVFSSTPGWIAGVLNIVPSLSTIVALASIYSLVLLYMGLQRVKDVPKEKMIGYFIVVIVAAILLYVVVGAIVGGIVFSSYVMPRPAF